MDYLKWLVDWFESNSDVTREELMEHLDEDFFSLEYIDSFGFIMLMGAVEEELGVEFDNDRFQDRSFSTINGFVRALEEEKKSES